MSTRKVQKGLEVIVSPGPNSPNIGRFVTVPPEGFLVRLRLDDPESIVEGAVGSFVVDLVDADVPDAFIAQLQDEISQLRVTISEKQLRQVRHERPFPISHVSTGRARM